MFAQQRVCWAALCALFLTRDVQMQDVLHSPAEASSKPPQQAAEQLPYVFPYQGQAGRSWVCCTRPPSVACIKWQQDCPACAPCLPPMSSRQSYNPSGVQSQDYFRGQPVCRGICYFRGAGRLNASPGAGEQTGDAGPVVVYLQNRGRPMSPIMPPPRPQWPGPPLPPRNQPPPRPPPPPPRPPRGGWGKK